jgi:hypothetical protein
VKRNAEAIYGTTRWRSYALCNAAMNFDAAGDAVSASALYIRALEADDSNLAARMNLGALLLECEDDRVHSAMNQLEIAKREATLDDQTENDAVYYSATFRLAAAKYQKNDIKAAICEAQELHGEIKKALKAIVARRRTPGRSVRLYAVLRLVGMRRTAARLRARRRGKLLRSLENDALFGRFLNQLKPSVIVMIAGLRKEAGENVSPPQISNRDLWRPIAAFQYNLACTAAAWLRDARAQIEAAKEEAEAARKALQTSVDDHLSYEEITAASKRHVAATQDVQFWAGEDAHWTSDALAHLEFAIRLEARTSALAARDRSMQPLREEQRFKDLISNQATIMVPPSAPISTSAAAASQAVG